MQILVVMKETRDEDKDGAALISHMKADMSVCWLLSVLQRAQ